MVLGRTICPQAMVLGRIICPQLIFSPRVEFCLLVVRTCWPFVFIASLESGSSELGHAIQKPSMSQEMRILYLSLRIGRHGQFNLHLKLVYTCQSSALPHDPAKWNISYQGLGQRTDALLIWRYDRFSVKRSQLPGGTIRAGS